MENKSNEATPQRPEGARLINAPLVEMDLNGFIAQIKAESTWAKSDHNAITIFKGDSMRVVLIGMHENAELKTHSANGIINVQVLEGKIDFTSEQQTVLLEKRKNDCIARKNSAQRIGVERKLFSSDYGNQ